MGEVIVGSDAVSAGILTRGQLRWNYRQLYPDVYIAKDVEPTLAVRARGAWLWSNRRGVITGRAAAAIHGAKWVDAACPIEMLWSNNRPPDGIITRRERIAPGEITYRAGIPVATPARAALDLGRKLRGDNAVAHLDALSNATGVTATEILALAERYKGTNGVRKCRESVDLMDAGAQSPKETWLRLLLIDDGFPRPVTQIPLIDHTGYKFAYLDMGWPELKIAVEYDGEHHRTDTEQYRSDARRLRKILAQGWIHIRVITGDRRKEICSRVDDAWQLRQSEGMVVKMPA
ncbi:hypothetical protein CRI77_22135 [Mycolicibacterium duvalii]|uniref:Uncharacterized protein n=1 Tax=Mycolicibacterium duvalii TaxID=39688 RepID=A0A7I7K1B6_9MYCO|nr:hypothetical protein [Mycolicibacterium duvalii]MCV7370665.1 hypothetical protein [Mycolicibacterium duvalii]PEG36865.1 hypothetical protein CRI77_22135 [Mycolicibacterium duvalii]BBX17950.1 hypothetical protein MDUV_28100 [Mycolicibacterium duvalii]